MILCTAYMIAQAQGWPEVRERLPSSSRNAGSTAHKWVPEGTHDSRSLVEFLEGSHSDRLELASRHAHAEGGLPAWTGSLTGQVKQQRGALPLF